MAWLSQNWIWIAVAVGVFLLFRRMGVAGCGMGGCGMSRLAGNTRGSASNDPPAEGGAEAAFDPVTRQALPAGAAISSVHQGRAYYFESRQNRDEFESNSEKYLAGSPEVGRAIASKSKEASDDQPRQRVGCC